jgi:hypothetical protein
MPYQEDEHPKQNPVDGMDRCNDMVIRVHESQETNVIYCSAHFLVGQQTA